MISNDAGKGARENAHRHQHRVTIQPLTESEK